MKATITIGIIALLCGGCSNTRQSRTDASLLHSLRPYVNEVASELDTVSSERKAVLGKIAADITTRLEAGKEANLTFICTHNSRRRPMSQIWANTAAYH